MRMSLPLGDRVVLAHQAYLRAVALARARTTAASWNRLLTAARNRAAALREQELSGGDARTLTNTARSRLGRGERGAPPPSQPAAPRRRGVVRSWELARELERARALMAWSRALVRQARELDDALLSLGVRRSPGLPDAAVPEP
jgi:hypothetical protein